MSLWLFCSLFFFAPDDKAPQVSPQQKAAWPTPACGTSRLAISPDGKTLATNSFDLNRQKVDRVLLRDAATGKVHVTLNFPKEGMSGLAFTPDGRQVITAHEHVRAFGTPQGKRVEMSGEVRLWDAATGQVQQILSHHQNAPVIDMALSPDGKTLAVRERWLTGDQATFQTHVVLWDLPAGRVRHVLPFLQGAFTFTPDSKQLIATSGSILVLNVVTGKELHQFGEPPPGSRGFDKPQVTPDGKTLIVRSHDHRLMLWDLPSRKMRDTISLLPERETLRFALSHDGRTLALAHHEYVNSPDLTEWQILVPEIVLYDLATLKPTLTLKGHRGYIPSLVFSPDGKHLYTAGGCDETIRVWNVAK